MMMEMETSSAFADFRFVVICCIVVVKSWHFAVGAEFAFPMLRWYHHSASSFGGP
jgi:hypothetical protein